MHHWRQHAADGRFGPPRRFEDGQFVFQRGEALEGLYLLHEGAVELVQLKEDGTSTIVKFLLAPTQFGVAETIAREDRYLVSVRAVGPCRAYLVPTEAAHAFLHTHPEAQHETLLDTCQAFCRAARYERAHLETAEVQLAAIVLAYASIAGRDVAEGRLIDLQRTQRDLAGAVGTSERQVNRILVDWKNRSLLCKRNQRYVVQDIEQLRMIAAPLADALIHEGDAPEN